MTHPLLRKTYDRLPPAVQQRVKDALKTPIERRRVIRHFERMARDCVRLANLREAVSGPPAPLDDLALARRLMAAYRRADAEGHRTGRSMWTDIFERMHGDVRRLLLGDDVEAAAAMLRDPGTTNLFYGFDNLAANVLVFARSARWRRAHALAVADSLVRLAELVGARRAPNTEVISMGARPREVVDAAALLPAIDRALGLRLPNPLPFPGEHGLVTDRGVMAYRAPQAIWQAKRIRDLTRDVAAPAVLEIGGGLGRTALYARAMGITDYTIVDLPLTMVAQGSFLGRVLGEEAIDLMGESAASPPDRVKLRSPHWLLSGGDGRRYDLVVNVDSLTEMSPEVAAGYVRAAAACARRFLSVNHEANPFTVRELIAAEGLADRLSRTVYPMRDGYLEEIVDFGRPA